MPLEGLRRRRAARRARRVLRDAPADASGWRDKEAGAGEYVHFDARALRTSRTHEAVVMHPLPRTDELAYELDSRSARGLLRAGRRRRAGADGADRVAAGAKRHRARTSGCAGARRFASRREPAAAMRQSELYHAPRGRLPRRRAFARARVDRLLDAAADVRVLRARTARSSTSATRARIAIIVSTKPLRLRAPAGSRKARSRCSTASSRPRRAATSLTGAVRSARS